MHANNAPSLAQNNVFWPADLLPADCPSARVLLYGYDSKITKYMVGATNKNSLLSHSKDLLFALERHTVPNRPLVFLAHSLGGIVVKEMLSRSSTAGTESPGTRNIVESTAAVVFLGTPHRGSPDLAAMGEWMRTVISALRVETTPAILDALGLRSTDLERAQEAFSQLWHRYNFQVKTFQEGLGLTGINLGVLGNKVVPDYSSLIGDYRERAETLQANHMDMCRFSGGDDPNYRKVAGELRSIYLALQQGRETQVGHGEPMDVDTRPAEPELLRARELSEDEKAFLRSLSFPSANSRFRDLERPVAKTCTWLYDHPLYQDWINSRNIEYHNGLLWLKGQPGSGKSTLMGDVFRKTLNAQIECKAGPSHLTAAFFFNAKGDALEHSPEGLFRSLLHQLLPRYPEELIGATNMWKRGILDWTEPWTYTSLKNYFQTTVLGTRAQRVFIFLDALDECDQGSIRLLGDFWRGITRRAHKRGIRLNVCISTRHFPCITLGDYMEITMEHYNKQDIRTYVDYRFGLVTSATDLPGHWQSLRDAILERSAGVFLWAVLVVDDVVQSWDAGNDFSYLQKRVQDIPQELSDVYAAILLSVPDQERPLMVRLFQWATLTTKPLRLHEWHHVVAFIQQPLPESLHQWRQSINFTANDAQLERKIRSASKGLVEVKKTWAEETRENNFDGISVCAGAGSLNLEMGETRVVQVIHETVRDFFLRGGGFAILDPALAAKPIGQGHLAIMWTCLDYIQIKELDALVQARSQVELSENRQRGKEALGQKGRHQTSEPSSPARSIDNAMEIDDILGDMERATMPELGRIDINSWLSSSNDTKATEDTMSLAHSTLTSTDLDGLSISGRSQVLEDYPALLSYALSSMFRHAQLAEDDGAYSTSLVERFLKKDWNRWRILREDITQDWTVLEYAATYGLATWTLAGDRLQGVDHQSNDARPGIFSSKSLESFFDQDDPRPHSQKGVGDHDAEMPRRGSDSTNNAVSPLDLLKIYSYPSVSEIAAAASKKADAISKQTWQSGPEFGSANRRIVRKGSVASFGSAGSHQ